MAYRITRLTFGPGDTLIEAVASAATFATMPRAMAEAETFAGASILWAHADLTRSTWQVGSSTKPSAYRMTVVVHPAAKGQQEILDQLAAMDAERRVAQIRAEVIDLLDRRKPAPTTPDGGIPA